MIQDSKAILSTAIDAIKQDFSEFVTCFLITHVPNPRLNKRIQVFKELGSVYVLCTRRSNQDIWEPQHKDVEHILCDIDIPPSRQLIKRAMISRGYQKQAIKKLEELKPNIIYTQGLDSLIIANVYKKRHNAKVFYEVPDLREWYIEQPKTLPKRIQSYLVKQEEIKDFASVDYLVLTSPKFYDVHYYKLIAREKMLFIPNAPDAEVFIDYERKEGGEFTVGFIGGIRYIQQMKLLVDAAEIAGCKVLFAGAAVSSNCNQQISDYCKDKPFVAFTGKYNFKEDIARLYGMVDCVYSVYDADNPNVRIALPNKLYEAVICELPIIVAKGTYLAELVEKYGIGISVDHKSASDLVAALNELKKPEVMNSIRENCRCATL